MDPELKAILDQLAGAAGPAADAVERLGHSMETGLPDWERANNGVKLFGKRVTDGTKKTRENLEKLSTGFKSATSSIKGGLKSLGSESESGAKSIKNITDSVGDAVKGFTSQFGFIGGAIGGVATALTGMAGVALGFIDELAATNRKLAETGILLGDTLGQGSGIDEFDAIIRSTGLSAQILTKTIEQSGTSLRLFGGGASTALRTVTQGFKNLKEANNKQLDSLYKLGYTAEDVMAGMVDLGAAAHLAGRNLSLDELTEGATKYLTMQRELTKLTGTQVKDAKANAEAMKSDVAYRRMLQEAGAKNAGVLEQILANTNESLKPLVKTLVSGGQVTNQQMALIQQALGPEFVNEIRGIGEKVRSGVEIDPKAVVDEYKAGMKAALDNANEYIQQYSAAELQTYQNAGGPFGEFLNSFGPILNDLNGFGEALKTPQDNAAAVATGMGKIASTLPDVERASIALRSALYTVGSTLTATFAPLIGGLAGMIDGGASALQRGMETYTKGLNEAGIIAQEQVGRANSKFADENERQAAYAKKLGDTMAEFGKGSNLFEGLFKNLGDTISSAISIGFSEAIKEINPFASSKRETREFGESKEFKDIQDKIKSLEAGTQLDRVLSWDELSKLQSYLSQIDPEAAAKKLEDLGVANAEVKELFGLLKSEHLTKVTAPTSAATPNLPKHAFGEIMDPKPGGHVVRVAEAGDPEIIAPAKRGPGGKLGLEVTGTMLDNSQLLKSLVEINKNQASLIAGMNSKIENMNSSMEKLVYEQRQANRLAV